MVNQRARRFVGMTGLVLFVLIYIALAMVVGAEWFAQAHPVIQLVYFVVAGMAWVVPAAMIIKWMRHGDNP